MDIHVSADYRCDLAVVDNGHMAVKVCIPSGYVPAQLPHNPSYFSLKGMRPFKTLLQIKKRYSLKGLHLRVFALKIYTAYIDSKKDDVLQATSVAARRSAYVHS